MDRSSIARRYILLAMSRGRFETAQLAVLEAAFIAEVRG